MLYDDVHCIEPVFCPHVLVLVSTLEMPRDHFWAVLLGLGKVGLGLKIGIILIHSFCHV